MLVLVWCVSSLYPICCNRFQPEVDESTLGAVGGVGTGLGPDGVQIVGPDQVINEDPSLQNAGKKEPRYSQVSSCFGQSVTCHES